MNAYCRVRSLHRSNSAKVRDARPIAAMRQGVVLHAYHNVAVDLPRPVAAIGFEVTGHAEGRQQRLEQFGLCGAPLASPLVE